MLVFAILVFFMRGRWSPRAARRDLAEHDRIVSEELAKLARGTGHGLVAAGGRAPWT